MICLQIKSNKVVNSAVFDECPNGWIKAPEGVGIGWKDNKDGTFSPPAGKTVSDKEKAKHSLMNSGHSHVADTIDAIVDYIVDGTELPQSVIDRVVDRKVQKEKVK